MNSTRCFMAILSIIGLLAVIFVCYNFNLRLTDLENNRGKKSGICASIKGTVRIFVIPVIIFCLVVSIHYIAVFFPRFVSIEKHNTYYENLGIDYWGIIVGFFSFLVTILVGWNIYSTIRAKEELKEIRRNLNKEFGEKIKSLENMVFKLSLRNNERITSSLNIDTCFELLKFIILHSKKCQMRGKEPRFKKAEKDIIYILEDFKERGETIACDKTEFKNYALIAKRLNLDWMKKYVISFTVFNKDMRKRLTPQEKETLFKEA